MLLDRGGPADHEVRDRIFASALRHFSRKGFAATSLREISDDAATTKPMIYYYFGSKEKLYSSIVRQILKEIAASIRMNLAAEVPAVEQARSYCRRYVEHFLAHEECIALILREVFGLGGAPMAQLSAGLGARVLRQPLDAILRRGMTTGELARDDVDACATAITGILNMFILAHVFGGVALDVRRPLRQVDRYLEGMKLPARERRPC